MCGKMRIANPIYDSVFKRLMENRDIARGLLSRLLGVSILELEARPQETSAQAFAPSLMPEQGIVRLFRVDFAAVVSWQWWHTKGVDRTAESPALC
ncbi:MAG: hypothetical protein EBV03_13280 [Proteobacteria bacterium]|nr:hypothetical protein [Pseudomonadota bacterium]